MRVKGFCWEVNGNGLEVFFENSQGNWTHEIYDDLRLIGAGDAAALLQEAMQYFPRGKVPADEELRCEALKKALKKKGMSKRFDQLTRELQAIYSDHLRDLIWEYARKNRSHFDTPIASQLASRRIRLGTPVRYGSITLEGGLDYPIWLCGSEVNLYDDSWHTPVVSPKRNVSDEVLQEAAKRFDRPRLVFQVEETGDYGTGLFDHKKGNLGDTWFWKDGKWVDLVSLGGPSATVTLVPLAKIRGEKSRFRLERGKYWAILQAKN